MIYFPGYVPPALTAAPDTDRKIICNGHFLHVGWYHNRPEIPRSWKGHGGSIAKVTFLADSYVIITDDLNAVGEDTTEADNVRLEWI